MLGTFYVHETTVRRYQGTSGYGEEIYSPATTEMGWVDDTRRMVRNSSGDEVVSSTTVFYPLTVDAIPPGSLVTLPAAFNSRESSALAVSVQDPGPIAQLRALAHVEVSLT